MNYYLFIFINRCFFAIAYMDLLYVFIGFVVLHIFIVLFMFC